MVHFSNLIRKHTYRIAKFTAGIIIDLKDVATTNDGHRKFQMEPIIDDFIMALTAFQVMSR